MAEVQTNPDVNDFDAQRAALVAEQAKEQKSLDAAMEAVEEYRSKRKRLPAKHADAAQKHRDRVVELGTQIEALEREAEKSESEYQEFMRTMAMPSNADKVVETMVPEVVNGDAGGEQFGYRITQETVAQFREQLEKVAGSSGMLPAMPLNERSEALICEMVGAEPRMRAVKGAEWDRRALEINRGAIQRQRKAGVLRTVLAGTDLAGGHLVPTDNSFMSMIQASDAAYGGVDRICNTFTTPDGRNLPVPTMDNLLFEGDNVAENAQVPETDVAFGQFTMNAHMITSGQLSATIQAVQDAATMLPQLLGYIAGRMINRREAYLWINGTGAAQPTGLVTAFTENGLTIFYDRSDEFYKNAAGDTTRANWTKIFTDLKYTVNPFWRRSARFALVVNDQMDQAFASATVGSDDHRPLFPMWTFGNAAKGGGIDLGGMMAVSDYSIAPHSLTANGTAVVGWVGDFEQYWIRRVAGMYMVEDPYSGKRTMERQWVFGRRCDARGLFGDDLAARNARAGANPARAARTAAIERFRVTTQA